MISVGRRRRARPSQPRCAGPPHSRQTHPARAERVAIRGREPPICRVPPRDLISPCGHGPAWFDHTTHTHHGKTKTPVHTDRARTRSRQAAREDPRAPRALRERLQLQPPALNLPDTRPRPRPPPTVTRPVGISSPLAPRTRPPVGCRCPSGPQQSNLAPPCLAVSCHCFSPRTPPDSKLHSLGHTPPSGFDGLLSGLPSATAGMA